MNKSDLEWTRLKSLKNVFNIQDDKQKLIEFIKPEKQLIKDKNGILIWYQNQVLPKISIILDSSNYVVSNTKDLNKMNQQFFAGMLCFCVFANQ